MSDPSLEVTLFLVLAALVAGFVDAVVGGGGLVQLPALLVGLPGASVVQMPYLILTWGEGRYHVTRILDAPAKRGAYTQFLVVQRATHEETNG